MSLQSSGYDIPQTIQLQLTTYQQPQAKDDQEDAVKKKLQYYYSKVILVQG
jgi:hypothetical protein